MEIKFICKSSTKLRSGAYSTNLISIVSENISGASYWVRTSTELSIGEIIELDISEFDVLDKETKNNQLIRIILPKL